MEQSSNGNLPVPYIQQLIQNKFLLLTVVLAIGAAAYFVIGIFMLLKQ